MMNTLTNLLPNSNIGSLLGQAIYSINLNSCAAAGSALLASYISWKIIYALYFSPLRNIPGPFLARLTSLRARFVYIGGKMNWKCLEEYRKYGPIYVAGPNEVIICDPKDCRNVLSSYAFCKTEFYKLGEVYGIENVFTTADGAFNRMRRRQIGPSFSASYVAQMEDKIIEIGIMPLKNKWDTLIEQHGGRARTNYSRDFNYMTFDIVGGLGFGKHFRALENNDPTAINWIANTQFYFSLRTSFRIFNYPFFAKFIRKYKEGMDNIATLGTRAIRARRELNHKTGEKPKDLLQAYIDAEDPESKNRMTTHQVLSETTIMIMAGTDTTGSTLMWAFNLLMLYPDVYKRLVDEVRSTFDRDHVIRYSEGRANLPYLEAFIYECLRYRPTPGGAAPRYVPKSGVTIKGHHLPAGTVVSPSMFGLNFNEDTWVEPHKFNPDRFVDNEEAKRSIFTFSAGVRICPGRILAWTELIITLANVLKDYDLSLPDDALSRPEVLGDDGQPATVESNHYVVTNAKCPERDCNILISKRAD